MKNLVIQVAATNTNFSILNLNFKKNGVFVLLNTIIQSDKIVVCELKFPVIVNNDTIAATSKGDWVLIYSNHTDPVNCSVTLLADDEYLHMRTPTLSAPIVSSCVSRERTPQGAPSGEAGTIGYGMRASLTRRYNLPKPKYSFETIGLVWHYFF